MSQKILFQIIMLILLLVTVTITQCKSSISEVENNQIIKSGKDDNDQAAIQEFLHAARFDTQLDDSEQAINQRAESQRTARGFFGNFFPIMFSY